MALKRHTFEGATDGAAITGTESGSGDALSFLVNGGGSILATTAQAMHGTKSAKHTPASGQPSYYTVSGLSGAGLASRLFVYFTALPTSDLWLLRNGTGGGVRTSMVLITGGGKFRLTDTTSASTGIFTASSNFPTSQWVRLDMWSQVGATNTTGSLKAAYFLGDSTTAVSGGDSTVSVTPGTQNLGTTSNQTTVDFGKYDSSTYTTVFYTDDPTWDDAATTYVGSNTAPVATAGAAQTVAASTAFSLPWTATDADGNSLTYTATADPGNPTSLGSLTVGGTAPNKTVTGTAPSTAGKYLVNVKCNDGVVDSNTAVLTLYVTSTTSVPSSVVGSTNWTASTGTIIGCLTDANQSTYAQSPSNPSAESLTVQMTPFPIGATSDTISYEFSQDVSSPARSLTVTLYQTSGGSSIASKTEGTITTSVVAGSLVLTSGQLSSWTVRNESVITFSAS